MCSVHTTPEEFKNGTITGQEENSVKEITCFSVMPSFLKISFRPHENEKPAFSNSSALKSVFEKLRFRDGLVWTVGLTVKVNLPFQISSA